MSAREKTPEAMSCTPRSLTLLVRLLGCWVVPLAWLASTASADENPSPPNPGSPTLALRWSAPEGCPSTEEVRAAIDRLSAGTKTEPLLNIQGEVTHDPGGPYRLTLVMTDALGNVRERRVEGQSCSEVADAVAVIVSLSADPLGDLDSPASTPPAPPPPSRASSPASTSSSEGFAVYPAAPAAPSKRPVRVGLSAVTGFDLATLPALAPGVGAAAALDLFRNIVELRGMAWFPQTARLRGSNTTTSDIGLYEGSLRYCRAIGDDLFEVIPCAGLEAGAMVASRPAGGGSVVGGWMAPALSITGALVPNPHFAISLETEALLPVMRPKFVVTGGAQIFQPAVFSGRALAAIQVRFP